MRPALAVYWTLTAWAAALGILAVSVGATPPVDALVRLLPCVAVGAALTVALRWLDRRCELAEGPLADHANAVSRGNP